MEQRRRRQQQRSRERQSQDQAKAPAPQVEVGVADRRLDTLIEGAHGQGGRSMMASSSGGQGQGQHEARQLLNDPRGQTMEEAVRQSFEVLQHALQRPSPQPALLDPLLRPGDQGVHAGTGFGVRLALLCGRAEWSLSAWVHRPTWLWLDAMIYILVRLIPILPRRWDLGASSKG